MEQYISKFALLKKIKEIMNEQQEICKADVALGKKPNPKNIEVIYQFQQFIKSLNTLEVKEVDLDFQRFAKEMDTVFNLPSSETKNTEEEPLNWEYAIAKHFFELGLKAQHDNWKVENLWKPADGDNLPECEREVVVFTQNFPNDAGIMSAAIAHRPNPNGWDGKSLSIGKVEHYTPKTYGKGDWNIPDVKYWLDVELPKEIEL